MKYMSFANKYNFLIRCIDTGCIQDKASSTKDSRISKRTSSSDITAYLFR